jgi:DNA helicase-2/ATP-dependent DNA helicase PcrA
VDNFQATYSNLNTEQRRAVDAIDGPVLVLAGPGTGKTQLLSARVANILRNTDTDPASITCLTFTVNAANNMRERLRSMMGSTANQVVIKTFHSLAADIIAANPQHFYAGATLNPISELAAQEILQTIFDKLAHDNPLAARYDDRYSYLGSALGAIGKAKDAGLTPDALRSVLEQNSADIEALEPTIVALLEPSLSHKALEPLREQTREFARQHQDTPLAAAIGRLIEQAIANDLPTTKSAATSKLKSKLLRNESGKKVLASERRATAWWLALSDVYKQYQAMLYKRGYLDYSDMLIAVIDALNTNDDLRLDIQESTHYLLIDEFQDSNHAQITLAHLLTDNPAIDSPNIMVVGDPNQIIYGFNGAVLDNIDQFREFYADAGLTTVDLVENYRSTQQILDNAQQIIQPYTSYAPTLHANNPDNHQAVRYTAFASQYDQAINTGQAITTLLSKHPDQSVAVLGRSHNSLAYIARYLHEQKVSVNYEQVIDVRETTANKLILTIAQLVHGMISGQKQLVNHQLSLLIQHDVFELSAETLWDIATTAHNAKDWVSVCTTNPATSEIMEWLSTLTRAGASESAHSLIEQILSTEYKTGKTLYAHLFEDVSHEAAITEAQATKRLIDMAKQFTQTEHVGITDLLALMQSTAHARLFSFSPDTGRHSQAVELMTVHGAKGLEFDHVFIIDADDTNWKPSRTRYPIPLSLNVHTGLETSEDYARLMYVAMTRAKQSLFVSYVHRQEGKTTNLPAEQLTAIDFTIEPPASDNDLTSAAINEVLYPRPALKTMKELLDTLLANFKLSPTALTNYLDLTRGGPTHFIEQNLLKLPQPASITLIHGNAMHAAMELAQIQTNNNKRDLDAIKRLYAKKVAVESLPSQTAQRLISKGEAQLDTLFNQYSLALEPSSLSEQGLSVILSDNTPLYGKLDRLDIIDDQHIRIVDYKTGKPLLNMTSKSEPNQIKIWRHQLQLGFYMLLLKHTKAHKSKHYAAQIIQLDAESADHLYLDYSINQQHLAHIEKLASAVYRHVIELNMPDVSQFEPTMTGIKQFEEHLLSL